MGKIQLFLNKFTIHIRVSAVREQLGAKCKRNGFNVDNPPKPTGGANYPLHPVRLTPNTSDSLNFEDFSTNKSQKKSLTRPRL